MFNQLLSKGKEKLNELKNGAMKYKSRNVLEATLAGSALIAFADGSVDSEEKKKMLAFLKHNESLAVYDINEVTKIFNEFITLLEFEPDAAEAKIMQIIGGIKSKTEEARFIMRMLIAIASSDGTFDKDEKKVAVRIARELNLNPADFDLS